MIVLAPAPATAVPRITQCLDFDERNFIRQSWMGKAIAKMKQFVKQIDCRGPLGTCPPRKFLAIALVQPDNLLAGNERLDHQHAMFGQKFEGLAANGGERA